MDIKEKIFFLRQIAPFNLLEEKHLSSLAEFSETKVYEKDRFIFKQGEFTHSFLYLIVSGKTVISVSDNQGIDRVVSYRHPRDFFGETGFFTKDNYPASAKALTKTICLRLPENKFYEVMEGNTIFTLFFNRLLVDRMRVLYLKFMFEDDVKIEEPILNRKAYSIMTNDVVTASLEDSVFDIALTLDKRSVSSVVVVDVNKATGAKIPVGIISERDLVKRVLGNKEILESANLTAQKVMTTNLITVGPDAFVYQVFLLMIKHNTKHILVTDNNIIKGIITIKDIARVQSQKPLSVITDIESTDSFNKLIVTREKVDRLVHSIILEKASAQEICVITTEYYDRVTKRVVELAEGRMIEGGFGVPPVEYCLIIMGSGGRKEQYLPTDQDHALIFASPPEQENQLRSYFLKFGEEITSGLEKFGFIRCKGEAMANNKRWCLSSNEWIGLVDKWVSLDEFEPDSIMHMCIFLDFRWIAGAKVLYQELKRHVTETFAKSERTIRYLAMGNALAKGSPLTIFGNIKTHRNKKGEIFIDIKKDGCIHVVDCVRLFSLKHGVYETNTNERIKRLIELGVFTDGFKRDIEDIRDAYETLMKFRIEDSYKKVTSGGIPDNRLEWNKLNKKQQILLRESLVMVSRILSISSHHFKRDDRLF